MSYGKELSPYIIYAPQLLIVAIGVGS